MGTPACPFLYLLTRFTPCMQCDTSYNVTRLMATLVHSHSCLTRACQLHVTEVFRRIKNSYRVHTHKRWRPTYIYKTMDTPKRVNIFNSTFRLSCSHHHHHSWWWLQDSRNVELNMLTHLYSECPLFCIFLNYSVVTVTSNLHIFGLFTILILNKISYNPALRKRPLLSFIDVISGSFSHNIILEVLTSRNF